MDVAKVRARFSSLQRGFVFLDAPGGTQVPDEVGHAASQNFKEASGNIGFPYETSRRAGAVVDDARTAAARFLGCSAEEVIFGPNMTSLNFMLTRTVGRTLQAGDEIVTTRLDHDGNVAPWLELARDLDLVVRQVDIHPNTTLDYDDLARLLNGRTRVVSFPWASNAVGTTVDAARVCALAHEAGALAWIDAVQYAPHEPIDVRAIGADVLLCSSYKFCGPHLGIAYGRQDLLESWCPYKARPVGLQPVGHRFETGTLPYELLACLVATFSYLDSLGGIGEISAWEHELGQRLLDGLPSEARLYGSPTMEGRIPTFLLNFDGVPSSKLSVGFAERGFGVWSGDNYYALGLYERLNWGEALRVGLSHYNTIEEIDRFNEVLVDLVANSRAHHEAGAPRNQLSPGERFPVESLAGAIGSDHPALKGPVVVYFYPKDGTETCTREAAAFEGHLDRFHQLGISVVGVSTDTAESHQSFASNEGLRFALVSDAAGVLSREVGVMRDFAEYGELAGRVTFLLDEDGVVRQVWDVDDVVGHPDEILAAALVLGLGPSEQTG